MLNGNRYKTKGLDPNKITVWELKLEIEYKTGIPP